MKKVKINLNRKQYILLFANIILIIGYFLVTFFANHAVKGLYSQMEAERWETKKKPYAQVSAFISKERNMQEENISQVRSSLMEKLKKDSYNDSEKNARVWIDAYSGECNTVIRKDANTMSVTAVGIGGDFFQFHPIPLKSGTYISEADTNHDRVLLDENLAWSLFGSNDVAGMQIWMGDNIYIVAGVVSLEKDELCEMTYGNSNRMYMLYDELKKKQPELMVTCYEAVLPNPISNYAFYSVRDAFGITDNEEAVKEKDINPLNFDSVEVIENSNRFEWMSLYKKIKTLKFRSARTNSIAYPYWENVASVKEEEQIYYLIARIILLIIPVLSFLWLIYHLWKNRTWRVKALVLRLIEKLQDKREAKREEKLAKKEALLESEEVEESEIEEFEVEEYETEENKDNRLINEDYSEKNEE